MICLRNEWTSPQKNLKSKYKKEVRKLNIPLGLSSQVIGDVDMMSIDHQNQQVMGPLC